MPLFSGHLQVDHTNLLWPASAPITVVWAKDPTTFTEQYQFCQLARDSASVTPRCVGEED